MKIFVNNKPIELLPGMTVKHALIKTNLLIEIKKGKRVFDEWGNEIGLDGELMDGVKLFISEKSSLREEQNRA